MAEREIVIKIVGDATKAKQVFSETGQAADTFAGKVEGAGSKFGGFGTVAAGIVAAGAVQKVAGFLRDGATGAMEDAAAMDRLKVAVENTGVSFDTRSKSIDEAIKKGQELAFSDGDVMAALTNLTNATGDSDEALRRLTLAQDLARGTGMSLEQASKLLGKTSDENTATLARYGIQLGENATAQDVMNEVDKRFGGQAAAFAESDAGKWAQLQLQMTELQETIGGMLIPVFALLAATLATVFSALEPVTNFLSEHMAEVGIALGAVAAVIAGALVPALIAWAFTSEAAVVPALIATTVAAAPLILLAAAIAAAAVALYVAWEHNFLGIQDITQQVIDFVRPYIEEAMAAIQAVFDTVLPYLATAVQTAWTVIQTVFETVFPIIQAIVETYVLAWRTIIETALGIILGIFQAVWPVIQAVVETVLPIIAAVVETYINAVLAVVQAVLPLVLGVFQLVWDGIKLYVDTVLGLIKGAIELGMYAIKDVIGPILGALRDEVWNPIWNGLKETVDTLLGGAGTIISGVTTGIQDVYDAVEGKLVALRDNVWNPIWNGLKGTVDGVVGAVRDAWNFVAGIVNSGINAWNNLSFKVPDNKVTQFLGIAGLGWDTPNLPFLPTFGDGGGGGGYTAYGAGGGGDWVSGGSPPSGAPGGGYSGTGGGGSTPGAGYTAPLPILGGPDALAGLGNLSGGSGLGSIGRGGGSRGGALSAQQSSDVAQMVAAGVPADQAIAAVQSSGGGRSGTGEIQWSGKYAFKSAAGYRKVQLGNGLTGYAATGNDDEWFGGGGLSIFMDGLKVGRLVGGRHRRESFMYRDPVGGCS